MPRKAGREAGREAGGESVEVPGEVPLSDQEIETYERVEFLKEKFGDDATGRAQIQRRLKDGRLIGLPSIPALTFDTDLVAKRYGGGRYYVRFYKGRQYLGDIEFELDESLKPEPPEQAKPVAAVGGGDGAPSWLAATLDKMGDAIKAMADRPAPAPPAAPDPMAMIKAIGETMKALTPAPPPAPPAPPGLAEQLALVESVVSVGTKIIDARGDGGSSGDAYMGAVEKLAEPITDLVRLRVQQEADRRALNPPRGRRALPPPARNAVTSPAAAPAAASGGKPMGAAWLVEIQRWVPMMVKRARANRSAEDTAFFILDELSEPTLQELARLAAMPDFGAQVARVLPAELNNYPEWTTEFLSAVQDYLFSEGDEATGAESDDEPDEPDGGSDSEPEVEEEPEVTEVFDLEAEAKRRLALLDDAPPKEPVKEPVPTR